jgi:YkoY family integral membrane protein
MLSFTLQDIPVITWNIGVLVFLEGLLSADNAVVLALMVRHLPRREQRRVLVYGIWGAIGFRIVAVLLAAYLIRFWWVEVLGGLYLVYLAASHFLWPEETAEGAPTDPTNGRSRTRSRRWIPVFWGTVIAVTWTDIVFSIDSILAAVAMAEEFPARFGNSGKNFIIVMGGVLGIITMRFVVRYFLMLLDRFPGLAQGAYFLVGWIGLKLLINGFYKTEIGEDLGFHIPGPVFWAGMLLIAVLSLVIRPRSKSMDEAEVSASLDLFESEEDPPSGPSETGILDGSSPAATGPEPNQPPLPEARPNDQQPLDRPENGPVHGSSHDVLEPRPNRVP